MGLYEEADEKRTGPILYSFTKLLAVNFRGRYKILIKKGPWDADCQRWSPVGDLGGILLRKISKIEVLRNGIFGILRPSECVIIILNLGVLIKPPWTLLDPPQTSTVYFQYNWILQTNTKGI